MSSVYIDKEITLDFHINFYKKHKIQIPFMLWNKKSLMRISIQVYNSREDVNKLLEALKTDFI
jgi:selenocysteine lyase/cysteine desulfurase